MNAKPVLKFVKDKAPTILMLSSIALHGGAVAYIITKDVPHNAKIAAAQHDTRGEKVKTFIRWYWLPALMFLGGSACSVFSNSISLKRNAALAASAAASAATLAKWKEAVKDQVDDKTYETIKTESIKKRMDDTPLPGVGTVENGADGSTWCYDAYSDRWFVSNMDRIRQAENRFIKQFYLRRIACLNDWYDELGLDHTTSGGYLEWDADEIRGNLEVVPTPVLKNDAIPAIHVEFSHPPTNV